MKEWPPVYIVFAGVVLALCVTALILGAMVMITTLAICATIIVALVSKR